jgi:hypothetical protein
MSALSALKCEKHNICYYYLLHCRNIMCADTLPYLQYGIVSEDLTLPHISLTFSIFYTALNNDLAHLKFAKRTHNTHTHTYIHTYIHTHIHTYIQTYTHTHTHTHTYIHTHARAHTHTHTHTHKHTHACTHTHTEHTHTHTHARARRARTHTFTHSHYFHELVLCEYRNVSF